MCKIKSIIFFIACLISTYSLAQEKSSAGSIESDASKEIVYEFVEEMPMLMHAQCDQLEDYNARKQCADMQLRMLIAKSIKLPSSVRYLGTTIYFHFIINKKGKMINYQVTTVPEDKEAQQWGLQNIQKIAAESSWRAGRLNNEAVSVRMLIPLTIKYK